MLKENQTGDRSIRARIFDDRAKWIMASVLMVGGAGAGLHYDYARAALEHPPEPAETISARHLIQGYLAADRERLAELPTSLGDTDRLINICLADREARQIPLSKLPSDPFRGNFATAASQAADAQQSDNERIELLAQVGKLQLQSIGPSGDHPVCIIDNRMYHEGEQVDNFTIERIGDGEVVVRSGGYRFELKIGG